jgi:hypothetical protein
MAPEMLRCHGAQELDAKGVQAHLLKAFPQAGGQEPAHCPGHDLAVEMVPAAGEPSKQGETGEAQHFCQKAVQAGRKAAAGKAQVTGLTHSVGSLVEDEARFRRPVRSGGVHPQKKKHGGSVGIVLTAAIKSIIACPSQDSVADMLLQQALVVKSFFHVRCGLAKDLKPKAGGRLPA